MTIYITELITGLLVIAGLFIWGEGSHEKLTFEIRSQHISRTLFTQYSKSFQTQPNQS